MMAENEYWYPLLTKSRHEKLAHFNLQALGYESFLPLYESVSQWTDRKKIVDFFLIDSYVFVRTNDRVISTNDPKIKGKKQNYFEFNTSLMTSVNDYISAFYYV